MSKPSKFPGLASVKLDEPLPPHALLVENAPPASAVIARLGDLQRIVLLQLALSGSAKQEAEAAAADKKGAVWLLDYILHALRLCVHLIQGCILHCRPAPSRCQQECCA